jgi:methyltransferase (TIGR00027 family)
MTERPERRRCCNGSMTSGQARISHVSDTALMTAAVRAIETDRPNGWVRDPFAARLAGERGLAMAHSLPGLELMCFVVGMRSRIIDDVVMTAIPEHGISTVLSVGAGLDTRPWRLALPADLRWLEVDLQPVLDYKAAVLAFEKPTCRIEHLAVDVNDPTRRRALFRDVPSAPALMITEGLLMYLPAATVEAIAAEAFAGTGIRYWLLELATRGIGRAIGTNAFSEIGAVRAPDCLDGEGIAAVLNRSGWVSIDSRSFGSQALKLAPRGRLGEIASLFPAAAVGEASPLSPANDLSGVHLFSHP